MAGLKGLVNKLTSYISRPNSVSPAQPDEERPTINQSNHAYQPKSVGFLELLESNEGRMEQTEIVATTEWSRSTVSRVLSEMESDNLIHKIPLGRTNVITLPDACPNWYSPPDLPVETYRDEAIDSPVSAKASAVLLVEDNQQDVKLLKEAFKEANITNPIHTVRDGLDAVEFIHQRGQFTDAPVPTLVLLDLELMVVDGFDVLRDLCVRDPVRGIPVIVLSHSDDQDDINEAYAEGATAYLTKPADLDGHIKLVTAIDAFWLSNDFHTPRSNH